MEKARGAGVGGLSPELGIPVGPPALVPGIHRDDVAFGPTLGLQAQCRAFNIPNTLQGERINALLCIFALAFAGVAA